ncbi:type II/IV secretion system protein [Candidatus Saccharibacteria bacterium]|nr:type II/IV secretion system protein [Candidatus Saccharibacteria bacterium]
MSRDTKADVRVRQQEEENTERRAHLLGLRYLDTRAIVNNLPLVDGYTDNDEMRKNVLVPLLAPAENQNLTFGITINTPQPAVKAIRERNPELNIDFYLISNSSFRDFMLRYDPPQEVHYDDVKIAKDGDSATIAEVSKTLESVNSDDLLDYLINQSYHLNASDIHIEPQREHVRVRFRVDGALHPVANFSHDKYRVVLAAIASRANISFAATDAQTGHLTQKVINPEGAEEILNMRIETVPTVHGQDAVIRLFNFDESLLNLDVLGLTKQELNEFGEIISHPHGMVMVVGPTGSGKSTTLYSIINSLNESSRKILTLEDPVEFSIPGISQIPVNTQTGDSFAEKLRAVLRLDPDVVMVGEIRDVDTAKTAVQASITGHLVLTTFHANSAATALSRMIDMIGVNPIFSTAIRLIIGQRLVRRLDDNTKEAYTPDEATQKWIRTVLQVLPPDVPPVDFDNLTLYRPVPTPENPFGFSGRIVLMEQMIVNEEIQKFLRGDAAGEGSEKIEAVARKQGMLTLVQQGVLRALAGETTLDEVNRVL